MSVDEAGRNVASVEEETGTDPQLPARPAERDHSRGASASIVDGSGGQRRPTIDAPLFHRTERDHTGQVPVLKSLTWQHVAVDPSDDARGRSPAIGVDSDPSNATPIIADDVLAFDPVPRRSETPRLLAEILARNAELARAEAAQVADQSAPHTAIADSSNPDSASPDIPSLGKEHTRTPAATSSESSVELDREASRTVDDDEASPNVHAAADAESSSQPGADLAVDEVVAEPVAANPAAATPVAKPAAEASSRQVVDDEINRLAYVPDMTEEELPATLPPILFAGADTPGGAAAQGGPSLRSERATIDSAAPAASAVGVDAPAESAIDKPAAPKPTVAPVIARATVARAIIPVGPLLPPTPTKRRKRRIFPTLVKLVIVLGLIAGGLLAAQKFLLAKQTWAADVEELAEQTERVTSLTFDHAVDVVEVDPAAYVARRSADIAATSDPDLALWRAVGVASPSTTADDLARLSMLARPVFYDRKAEEIVKLAGLPEMVSRQAMYRALTAALLDQRLPDGLLDNGSPSAVAAQEAMVDAAGFTVAQALMSSGEQEEFFSQVFGMASGLPAPSVGARSGYGATLYGTPGLANAQVTERLRGDTLLSGITAQSSDDGLAFDATRTVATAIADSHGMLFWYHMLAARIDADEAWQAAVGWTGDTVAVVSSGCWAISITVADAAAGDRLQTAAGAWSVGIEPLPVVARSAATTVDISVCPSPANQDRLLRADAPAFGASAVERAVIRPVDDAVPYTSTQQQCIVAALRSSGWDVGGNSVPGFGTSAQWVPEAIAAMAPAVASCAAAP